MIAKYDIFKLRSDGSFVRVEAVEDILAAKQRLDIVSAKNPGDYHLWILQPTSSSTLLKNLLPLDDRARRTLQNDCHRGRRN
jgi:hypothetical protein